MTFRIAEKFWTDRDVRGWSDDARLLALYLLTSPERRPEGLYHLPKAVALGHLQWRSWERLEDAWRELEAVGFVVYDGIYEVVLLPRALKYQRPATENHVKAALKVLDEDPVAGSPLVDDWEEVASQFCPPLAAAIAGRRAMVDAPRLWTEQDDDREDPAERHEAEFQEAWQEYPKRNGRRGSKKAARTKWHRLVRPGQVAAVRDAVRNYADHVALTGEYPADFSTWLNQERWEDYAEPTDPAEVKRGRSQADLNADRGGFVF